MATIRFLKGPDTKQSYKQVYIIILGGGGNPVNYYRGCYFITVRDF